MRWAGNVARRGKGEVYTGFWWGDLKDRDQLEELGVDWNGSTSAGRRGVGIGLIWLMIGTGGGLLSMR
jgi:hypothetical protein